MLGTPYYHSHETSSTMDDARKAIAEGAGHGTVCHADTQSVGRGRMSGRRWEDDGQGALLFTLVLHKNTVQSTYPLTQLLAAALCRRFETTYRLNPTIKWPNDVLIKNKKTAGILVEMEGDFYLAGMGINLLQVSFPFELRRPAISLAQALEDIGSDAIPPSKPVDELSGLLESIEDYLAKPPEISDIVKRLDSLGVERELLVGDPGKGETVKGIIRGLKKDGALLMEGPQGPFAVYSGEFPDTGSK